MDDKEHMRTVEINGVKIEVDMRTARRVEELRVGSRVKVLVKATYGGGHSVHPGVVVGFEEFKELPTIVVAYAKANAYGNENPLDFLYYNSASKDQEIVAAFEDDFEFDAERVETQFARAIQKHESEIAVLNDKRDYFRRMFRTLPPAEELVAPPVVVEED